MGGNQNQIERPPPFGEIPEDYLDPEVEDELFDPGVSFGTTADMRRAWSDWLCANGPGQFANVKFFGKGIGGVPAPAVDAYTALESALRATGYQPGGAWSNKCRKIANSTRYSLHSYGVAIDIDSRENPQSVGDPYSGKIKKVHVDAVLRITNTRGRRIWQWGGHWTTPDRMHFQLDQGPGSVVIDPASVAGAVHVELAGVTHLVIASSLNMRDRPTLSGALIAGLPDGTEVAIQPDAMQQNDDHQWARIEAIIGGQLVSGWVATDFLSPAPGSDTAASVAAGSDPVPDRATHRVTATSLNLRSAPTTAGAVLANLLYGSEVTAQPDPVQESDGYRWIKIVATTDAGSETGWVASEYLEVVG